MNSANKIVWIALVAVAIIAIGGYSFPKQTGDILGAFGTRFPFGVGVGTTSPTTTGALVVGGGTNTMGLRWGTCNLTTGKSGVGDGGGPLAWGASTTLMHFCAATGVQSGDPIWITLPSSSGQLASSSPLAGPNNYGGIFFVGAQATTSGSIGVLLANWTGVATSSYAQATTAVKWINFR